MRARARGRSRLSSFSPLSLHHPPTIFPLTIISGLVAVRRRVGFYSAMRREVPIRTFTDWRDPAPGFSEIDLVAHRGTHVRLVHPNIDEGGSSLRSLKSLILAANWRATISDYERPIQDNDIRSQTDNHPREYPSNQQH